MDCIKIIKELEEFIPKERIKSQESMKKHTTFQVGGPADIFVTIQTKEQLEKISELGKQEGIPITILGNGSNVLVKDKGIRGIVAKIGIDTYQIEEKEENAIVTVGSGIPIGKLVQILLKQKIGGLEFAAGIPGTIGGAIRMNAGAYGGEMKDVVINTSYFDRNTGKINTISADKQEFSYRHSIFCDHPEYVILEVVLELSYVEVEESKKKIQEYNQARKEKQPYQVPSAGSTFKRGNDFITAKLIDECGLKGYQIGGAQVSNIHAGFIVNTGNATAKDIITLVEEIKQKVYTQFQKEIQLEIEILGEEE